MIMSLSDQPANTILRHLTTENCPFYGSIFLADSQAKNLTGQMIQTPFL